MGRMATRLGWVAEASRVLRAVARCSGALQTHRTPPRAGMLQPATHSSSLIFETLLFFVSIEMVDSKWKKKQNNPETEKGELLQAQRPEYTTVAELGSAPFCL